MTNATATRFTLPAAVYEQAMTKARSKNKRFLTDYLKQAAGVLGVDVDTLSEAIHRWHNSDRGLGALPGPRFFLDREEIMAGEILTIIGGLIAFGLTILVTWLGLMLMAQGYCERQDDEY